VQSLSAGGVVVGQAVNLRPDLFKAALLRGPFLDVINSMLDPTLPLTVPEYLEWGDPNREHEYQYMARFCPYTNIRPQAYPTMLLLTSLDDSQVMYWEPVKYVAKLRALKTDANPLLLQVGVNAGHMGSSGRYDALREKAFGYAFVLSQVGFGHPGEPWAPGPPSARGLTASGGSPIAQAAATAARTASSGTPADTARASSCSPPARESVFRVATGQVDHPVSIVDGPSRARAVAADRLVRAVPAEGNDPTLSGGRQRLGRRVARPEDHGAAVRDDPDEAAPDLSRRT